MDKAKVELFEYEMNYKFPEMRKIKQTTFFAPQSNHAKTLSLIAVRPTALFLF